MSSPSRAATTNMIPMNDRQRLMLHQMIDEHKVEDQTARIRELKHSEPIRREVAALRSLFDEQYHTLPAAEYLTNCAAAAPFLFAHYTDIFNRVRKNEINMDILHRMLDVLSAVERGEGDQHEGAYTFGVLVKEMLADSARQKADKLDEERRAQSSATSTSSTSSSESTSSDSVAQAEAAAAAADTTTNKVKTELTWKMFKKMANTKG